MDNSVKLKNIVKHLVNGTFEENFCRICLSALAGDCENIFTSLCQEDDEFCVADVLYKMCEIQVLPTDRCNVCSKCFIAASMAYKLFTLAKKSDQVLNYYVDEIQRNVDSVDLATDVTTHSICVTLPEVNIATQPRFHYGGILDTNFITADAFNKAIKRERPVDGDENIVLVVKEKGERLFYRVQPDGTWKLIDDPGVSLLKKVKTETGVDEKPKRRRVRQPMLFKPCSRCPVKYRFIAKLKEHMKCEHDVTLYVCTICQAFMENEMDYENHIRTHTDVHVCALCNTMFRRRESIIAHLQWHESMEKMSLQDGARICEVCGMIFPNEAELKDHYTKRHDKKYTCYYCGRMYKAEVGFELHIKKHEKLLSSSEPVAAAPRVRHPCSVCGKDFGDARSLTWHQRLHTNERPFTCDTCGRGFVSLNRRNQHAVCAHQAPARQCPLCPALFHFRSMVNTHIKKVHLRAHVRRARGWRRGGAAWRTARVPVPDLAVDIQASVMEMQAAS